jgi:hypothetical protein
MTATQTGFTWTRLLFGLCHTKNSFSGYNVKTYFYYNELYLIAQELMLKPLTTLSVSVMITL